MSAKAATHASAPFYAERRRSGEASTSRAEKQAVRRAKKQPTFVGFEVHANGNGHDFTVETYPNAYLVRGNIVHDFLGRTREARVSTTGYAPLSVEQAREYAAGIAEAIAYASGEKQLPEAD